MRCLALSSTGSRDVFAIKLDAAGEDLKRQMEFGDGPAHVARAVAVDPMGGLYVAGGFYDRMALGDVTLAGEGLHVYVARFNADWR